MTIQERLEKLERELARTRRRDRLLFVGLVLTAVLLACGKSPSPGAVPQGVMEKRVAALEAAVKEMGDRLDAIEKQKMMRAESFAVVDGKGKIRALLDVTGLALYDENDEIRVFLNATKTGSGLSLHDENAKVRVMLDADKDGTRLLLSDENEKVRTMLVVDKDGPSLALSDENGKGRILLNATKDGPGLALSDENEKVRVSLNATKDGPGMSLHDENEKVRVVLFVNNARSGLGVLDENGKGIWRAP